jgi:outer membrane biosynthesis protein TonB
MDKSGIRKEIAALINSIKEHSDNIGNNTHIPQLELELILHKIEKLYQKSIVYNYLNSVQSDMRTVVNTDAVKVSPQQIVETAQKMKEEQQVRIEPVLKTEEPVAKPKVQEVAPAIISTVKEVVTPPPVQEKPVQKPVPVAEKVLPAEKPLGNKIQKPPISDLRTAIGINDKFQFANELFGGNMTEYDVAIQQFNSAGSATSAMAYFESLSKLYSWDAENETVKHLSSLIERRYS